MIVQVSRRPTKPPTNVTNRERRLIGSSAHRVAVPGSGQPSGERPASGALADDARFRN